MNLTSKFCCYFFSKMFDTDRSECPSHPIQPDNHAQVSYLTCFSGKYNRQAKKQQDLLSQHTQRSTSSQLQAATATESCRPEPTEEKQLVKREQKIDNATSLQTLSTSHLPQSKHKGNKRIASIDLEDPEQVESYLKKCCRDYHKTLIDEAKEQLKLQEDQLGLKRQERPITIDIDLIYFPLHKEFNKIQKFQSIQELKERLQTHENQILLQLGGQNISSVFYSSLEEKIKSGERGKSYYTFACSISGCNAILKCSCDPQACNEVYLMRNRHNHTITGQMLTEASSVKTQTIVLDEDLHEMFGFNKGVRSETRNLRYFDPIQRKKIEYSKKRERIMRRKLQEQNRKKELLSQCDNDMEMEEADDEDKRQTDHTKKQFIFNNRKVQDVEFKNIPQQLTAKGFIVDTCSSPEEAKIPDYAFITKKELLELAPHPTTIRIFHRQHAIKLDKRRGIDNTSWLVLTVSVLNQSLKPLFLALCISCRPAIQTFPKVIRTLFKFFPTLQFLVVEYEPKLFQTLKNEVKGKSCQLLLDHNDVLRSLKKYLHEEKLIKVFRQLMSPMNYYKKDSFEKYLRKRSQRKALEQFEPYKQYTLISREDYQGIDVDLQPEQDFFLKIRQRVRTGLNRYSLKLHLHNLFDLIYSTNKNNQIFHEQTLEIEKFHRDINLKSVRQGLTPVILNQFYLNYGQALQLEPRMTQNNDFQLEKGKIRVRDWTCSCGYQQMIGLPCKHLIAALRSQNVPYIQHIHKRWIISSESLQQNDEKGQRSRSRQKEHVKKKKTFQTQNVKMLKDVKSHKQNRGQQQFNDKVGMI